MHSMLKSSGLVSTRIEGWTEKKIAYMLESGRVLLPSSLERYESLTKFLREVACTVSHLSAIHHAYESGAELALITEDDVDFLQILRRSLILQLLQHHMNGRCYKF